QNADVKVSKFKFYADRNVRPFGYALGDRVYLLKQANKKGVSKKLSHKWTGPFTVVEVLSENNYLIRADANQKKQLVHANRLKRCFKPPSNTCYKTMIEESVNSSGNAQADWSPEAESQVTETNEEPNSAAEINPDSYWMDSDFLDLNEDNQPENQDSSAFYSTLRKRREKIVKIIWWYKI
ncbi:Transposon Ty3-G Gag-Pol poly, partial [Brachionus plicatilis]